MLHKILKNANGGTLGVFDYMCNSRIQNKTAKILKGNLAVSKAIFKSLEHKYKQVLCVGVLSFEENDLDEDLKKHLIQSFENTLLPNFKGRYNSLWIEHSDKNRLELNYIIVQFDFMTKKHMTVYFDKFDRERVNLWVAKQNHLLELSDSFDPRKKQVVENDKRMKDIEKYRQFDRKLQYLVSKKQIKNRTELIQMLHENNIKTKVYDNFMLLDFGKSKKNVKFKNSIYSNRFTSLGELSNFEKGEIDVYVNRDKSAIFRKNQDRFVTLVHAKEKALHTKYECHEEFLSEEKEEEIKMLSFDNEEIDENLKKEIENVTINTVVTRFEIERKSKSSSLQRTRKEREAIYKRARECHTHVRNEHERDKKRLQRSDRLIDTSVANTYEKCRNYDWGRQTILDATQRASSTIAEFAELEARVLEFGNEIGEFGEKINELLAMRNKNLNQQKGRYY